MHTSKRFRHAALALILCVLAGSVSCKKEEPKAAGGSGEKESAPANEPAPVDITPKFSVTAADFCDEIVGNSAAARTKYDGVRVELTGTVTDIENRPTGPVVSVSGPPKNGLPAAGMFGGAICATVDPEPWATLCLTQPVKVNALVVYTAKGCTITDARITLDGPSLQITVTAASLAAEYAKSSIAVLSKYSEAGHPKIIVVTGPLLENNLDRNPPTLVLGAAGASVICEYVLNGANAAQAAQGLQVGQTVKLAGKIMPPAGRTSQVLTGCSLITK